MIAKILASAVLKKLAKVILIAFLREMVKQTDNTVDDAMVTALEKAL